MPSPLRGEGKGEGAVDGDFYKMLEKPFKSPSSQPSPLEGEGEKPQDALCG